MLWWAIGPLVLYSSFSFNSGEHLLKKKNQFKGTGSRGRRDRELGSRGRYHRTNQNFSDCEIQPTSPTLRIRPPLHFVTLGSDTKPPHVAVAVRVRVRPKPSPASTSTGSFLPEGSSEIQSNGMACVRIFRESSAGRRRQTRARARARAREADAPPTDPPPGTGMDGEIPLTTRLCQSSPPPIISSSGSGACVSLEPTPYPI